MTRLFSAGLVIAATTTMATPVFAQDQNVTISMGYFAPTGTEGRVPGDVLNGDRCLDVTFQCEPLLFNTSDFGSFVINGEYSVGLGRYVEVSGGIGYQQRTVPSVYSQLTYPDGSEIRQDLKLRVVPITGIVRVFPTGRRAGFQPYAGIGIAALNWHYSETGDFVDPSDNAIFGATYVADGTEMSPVYLGGFRGFIGRHYLLGGEVRFQNADAPLPSEFLGNRLDLGGTTFLGTFTVRF